MFGRKNKQEELLKACICFFTVQYLSVGEYNYSRDINNSFSPYSQASYFMLCHNRHIVEMGPRLGTELSAASPTAWGRLTAVCHLSLVIRLLCILYLFALLVLQLVTLFYNYYHFFYKLTSFTEPAVNLRII